jgi:hypothetical protein
MEWLQQLVSNFTGVFKWWFILQPWQQALRVRAGRWIVKFEGGIHFRIPYFDMLFIQSTRWRVSDMGEQTITTPPGRTVSLTGALGYRIEDISPLYMKLHQAEDSIRIRVQGLVTNYLADDVEGKLQARDVIAYVNKVLDLSEYGLVDVEFRLLDFAVVKTYRFITESLGTHTSHSLQTDRGESDR